MRVSAGGGRHQRFTPGRSRPESLAWVLLLVAQLFAHVLLATKSASAQSSSCPLAGTAKVALTGAGDASAAYPSCFARFSVVVDASCNLAVLPAPAAVKWSYSALWTPVPVPNAILQACPTSALSGGRLADMTAAGVAAAIKGALGTALFGGSLPAVTRVALAADSLTIDTRSPGSTLAYSVVAGSLGSIAAAGASACTAGACAYSGAGGGCPPGRQALAAGASQICALCPPGMYCAGGRAMPVRCAVGSAATAGASACTLCPPGSFSAAIGMSACTLCAAGEFQPGSGHASCQPCPEPSTSNFPGASACLACYYGQPVVIAGDGGFTPGTLPNEQPSAGVVVATTSPSSPLSTQACSFNPFAATCTTLNSRTLAFETDPSCGVMLYVLGDRGCSKGNNLTTFEGAYADANTILATMPDAPSKTVGIRLARSGGASLDLTFFQLTADFDEVAAAATELGSCTDSLDLPSACPNGTVLEANPQAEAGRVEVFRQSQCVPCEPGYYCLAGTSTQCTPGTFTDLTGASKCHPCTAEADASASSPAAGAEGCDDCYAVGPSNPRISCPQCPAGEYSQMPGLAPCYLCPAGTFRAEGGDSTICSICPPGTFSAAGAEYCSWCEPGTAGPNAGTTPDRTTGKCAACPAGQYTGNRGAQLCRPCPAGSYNTAPGSSSCTPCGAGAVTPPSQGDGATSCIKCARGTFAREGETKCSSCPIGFKTGVDGVGASACTPCRRGYFASTPNSAMCTACTPGTYADDIGSRICSLCPAGFITGLSPTETGGTGRYATSATHCDPCPPRTYRPSSYAANVCVPCPKGRATEVASGATVCEACSPGFTLWQTTEFECSPCPEGTYAPNPAMSVPCQPCPIGSSVSWEGNSMCYVCSPGEFQNATGQAYCTECPPGTYNKRIGGTSPADCLACPAGQYASGAGNDGCIDCEGGSYQDLPGKSTCKPCPPGYMCAAGSVAPVLCRSGYYAGANSTYCTPCEAGIYSSQAGQSSCDLCPAGSYCPTRALINPTTCPAGTYRQLPAATSRTDCTSCPVNYYTSAPGQTSCSKCTSGMWTARLTGQTQCWRKLAKLPSRVRLRQ